MCVPFFNIYRSLTTAARSKRRVVVTGIGIVCPLGVGTQYAWEALINSKCGIKKLQEPDYDKLPCKIGELIHNVLVKTCKLHTNLSYVYGSKISFTGGRKRYHLYIQTKSVNYYYT